MLYGGYGVTVNTEACGAFNSGSIPDSHPTNRARSSDRDALNSLNIGSRPNRVFICIIIYNCDILCL